MALFPFYSTRKPRQYNHTPIYWNPEKEAKLERERRIKRELGMETDDEGYKPSIKGTFVQGTTHLKKSIERGDNSQDRTSRNVKLGIALVVIAVIFWSLYMR